ncbi:S8 family serine peptidase [Actinomadura luteofluorescens]|uniref:S8 family serine peptidase n=1 Tax=Actinomadura luteofluorescens TaxID=46163 RepID=UPI00363C8472
MAWAASRFNGDGRDCNGHGTHVAGIIGSKTYGAAKSVKLRALRVLDCNGEGSMSDIVDAANWLRTHAAKLGRGEHVPRRPQVHRGEHRRDEPVQVRGVHLRRRRQRERRRVQGLAAGAGWVMAVGATTKSDTRASFSNWGKCVDINAPGYGVYSTWPGNRSKALSGTSMAAPYVSGVAALYLSTHPKATFPTVQKVLNDNSTHTLKGLRSQPNRLLWKGKL